jgi:hypothetical protein
MTAASPGPRPRGADERLDDGVALHLVVVLADDPVLAGDVGVGAAPGERARANRQRCRATKRECRAEASRASVRSLSIGVVHTASRVGMGHAVVEEVHRQPADLVPW